MRPRRGVGPAEWRPRHHSLAGARRSRGTSLWTRWHTSQPHHSARSQPSWHRAAAGQRAFWTSPRGSQTGPAKGHPRAWPGVEGGGGRELWRGAGAASGPPPAPPWPWAPCPWALTCLLRAGHGARCPSSVPVFRFRGCLQATRSFNSIFKNSVQFGRSVMCDSLQPHGRLHTRPPGPSPTVRVYSNSFSSSQ